MRSRLQITALLVVIWSTANTCAFAGPSTTFWTPCSIAIQPPGTGEFSLETFSEFATSKPNSQLPSTFGFEFGSKVNSKLNAEYGVDLLTAPSRSPLLFNGKIGYLENVLSKNAPALQLGYWGFGTGSGNPTSQVRILQLTTGKTLPGGRLQLMASAYTGNASGLRSSTGEVDNSGFMFAFAYTFQPSKWTLVGDYASGKNAIGGGGIGAYYYFSDFANVLFGPVWFNDKNLNGSTKLLMQISIGF